MFHQDYQEKLRKRNLTKLIVHQLAHHSSKDSLPFILQILVEEHVSLLKRKQTQLIWKPGEQQ